MRKMITGRSNVSKTGIIEITRGDSYEIPLFISIGDQCNTKAYIPEQNQEIYFGLTEPNQPFEKAILKKKYLGEDFCGDILYLEFYPNDTICLMPGKYYYTIKLKEKNAIGEDIISTVVDKQLFYIRE